MSLYKRKDSPNWWVKITHSGQCLQQSTGTSNREKAREYHDKLKAALWEQERLGARPSHCWNEAVVRYLVGTSHKASQADDKSHLRWLDGYLNGVALDAIDRVLLNRIAQHKKAEGVSNATVNRMLEVIRAIMRKAMNDWEWIDRVPRIRMLPEPKRRIRWITREEAERLLAELPEHLRAMATFSLETGLRKSNVTGLQWSQVDLRRRCAWIHPDQAKGRKAIAVPLSAAAILVLREQIGKHPVNVFTYRGNPIKQLNTKAWRAALRRAGIEDFRWHDLRHTWASWHVQAGTPLHVLQELGGWESVEMVRRYAHLSSDLLVEYVDRMSGSLKAVNESKGVTNQLRAAE